MSVRESKHTKLGYQVVLRFIIIQHSRDYKLLENLVYYLGCGSYHLRSREQAGEFAVSKFSDNSQKIIPFFEKYPLQGVKYRDYLDFCEVANIMREKGDLTDEGIRRIKSLKSGMNTGRIYD